jgi:superoxide dismutase, Fe-Mn family
MNEHLSRRSAFIATAAGGLVLLSGCAAQAQQVKAAMPPSSPPPPPSMAPPAKSVGLHSVRPLPFVPSSLTGLSERLITSHHDNNYAGAVKNLNKVEEELGRVNSETPAFVLGGLKQSELTYRNSATFHELYFANLGGDGRLTGNVEKVFSEHYGTAARWEALFRAAGASLSGGSGWVVTAWDLHRDTLVTSWSGNHTQTAAATLPILVMDMYEHAYQLDYGAAAAKYMDAFFANIQWEEVGRRLEKARKASLALRG